MLLSGRVAQPKACGHASNNPRRRPVPFQSYHQANRIVKVRAQDDEPIMGKSIDAAGAGASFTSPGWLTQLNMLWGGKGNVPVANAQPDDIKELLGGALFKALYKWMQESGPVYLLPTGPVSSFLVISDPAAAKHVLRATDNSQRNIYNKGLVAEVSQFLFGKGFAVAGGDDWKVRRRAVGPSLHRAYLEAMLVRVFGPSSEFAADKLRVAARSGTPVNMEAMFSQLTLDIIGKAVFNYDFNSLTSDSPLIQAVYTALKETEQRATDLLPLWKVPALGWLIPRQRKALQVRHSTLVRRPVKKNLFSRSVCVCVCFAFVVLLCAAANGDFTAKQQHQCRVVPFLNQPSNPPPSRRCVSLFPSPLPAASLARGSALTWTLYLLVQNPDKMAKAVAEVESVMGSRTAPTLADYGQLRYVMRCVNESMRLYPHPPVLLRRALVEDELPGGYKVPVGQDVMISVYNIHHSEAVWDNPEAFIPERFGPLDGPVPSEQNTDFRYIPFSGGPRKCVGDQFALMEAVVALAVLLRQFDFSLVPNQKIGMTTGATIHTTDGLYMYVKERRTCAGQAAAGAAAVTAG
ncbi:hypothetical protein VOLCADRAFT_83281 [Volvox carteri f. nagariensis]|uniref:Cytochrome P450 n=1 Tax=Volvox carteri f. nagariensis TaxID=3068 RepID=D8UA28_VOLCA|nr:uncharacterized protein VOLCADRAFT_83281 [Volvox carteri f. nagariensis]EFJ43400.1 hypothetical protein VOLCADRAFT_83281 [Volvox carteri f. nagariensis]|eukprot:XP_002955547.1 hypothetical protein VOLCADRAFT_83281 [Volvox carteri f. nagariensis]